MIAVILSRGFRKKAKDVGIQRLAGNLNISSLSGRNIGGCCRPTGQATSACRRKFDSIISFVSSCKAAVDRLTQGQELSLNQTMVSAGGVFAMGFFNPGNSTASQYYLGMWYNGIPQRTVVWVANRVNPLTDASGVLTVSGDGNIAVVDGKARVLWSTNVTAEVISEDATAVLLDSGNFVLMAGQRQSSNSNVLWQSFDHPTDTLLPTMKLLRNRKQGIKTRLVAWKAGDDPSPGEFSVAMDPDTPMQVRIYRGSQTWMRGLIWKGAPVGGAERVNSTLSIYVPVIDINGDEIDNSFFVTEGSGLMRWVLQPNGHLSRVFWSQSSGGWTVLESFPTDACSFYALCGPNGLCVGNGSCRCMEGFVPQKKEAWSAGNFFGGCVRVAPVACGEGDGFLRLEGIKVPDRFMVVKNVTAVECEEVCRRNRSCTAYFFANTTSYESSTRCLVWAGELVDLQSTATLPAAELSLASCPVERREDNLSVPYKYAGMRTPGKMLASDPKFSGMLRSKENTVESLLFHFSTIVAATGNFSASNVLGQGGFGPVYKGKLQDEEVAVKRLSKCSGQGFEEFKNEVELIARLQHQNIVQLVGWCLHKDEKILIYEYLPNRSLDQFIFDPSRSAELDWAKRFHIIQGIAHGLLYLHQHSRLHVVHRDLKTSNILVDGALNPKISDFGLARMFGANQTEATTERIVGTYGYMSPEYALNGLFSEKSDVFSFGVILLEIICGKRNARFYPYKESLNLLGYAWHLWEEKRWLEMVDPVILESCNPSEVEKCVQVGLLCVQEDLDSRATMSSAVQMLLRKQGEGFQSPKVPAFAIGRKQSSSRAIPEVHP
ncbi:hypothetical protein Taro_034730 [Colocasia esculenta]|uniref:Receptor-like serine/threonine-protein kinase n=1 Tax=Colocasia esculenta TaxID=4460 RepID=A0A843W4S2_COLES|nr:hypothetical protein [Colocasia esculenta]